MPRRFVTAEDVRRASGGEIVVDDSTVVTPQALETARSAGVTIRTSASGTWVEPAPDRGPDAQLASQLLPQLPEPSPDPHETGVMITVVGRNRPGVLAEVTAALGRLEADVRDISQKTIQDYFHLVLTVELDSPGRFAEVKAGLEALGGPDDYVVRVMHERVFRFMHRI